MRNEYDFESAKKLIETLNEKVDEIVRLGDTLKSKMGHAMKYIDFIKDSIFKYEDEYFTITRCIRKLEYDIEYYEKQRAGLID